MKLPKSEGAMIKRVFERQGSTAFAALFLCPGGILLAQSQLHTTEHTARIHTFKVSAQKKRPLVVRWDP